MKIKRIALGTAAVLAATLVVAGGGAYLWAERHDSLDAIDPPDAASFDSELIDRGETLAAAGFCASCHTRSSAEPYAGGRPMETPFGVVHATNITPDPETGIGRWSADAFRRAMHQGIRRDGAYLYPVFPYDHFTRITDDDIDALYAYFMTRKPVEQATPENGLSFPFNVRTLLAGWTLLYLDEGRFEPDPDRDDEWNRGAYLVEGLGHCGACHTPRNDFGAVNEDARFTGARVDGWYATPLIPHSPAPVPWSEFGMVNYLIDGWDMDYGIANGPMQPVVNSLARLPEDDVYAISTYLLSFQDDESDVSRDDLLADAEARAFADDRVPEDERLEEGPLRRGQQRFADSCANCHRSVSDTAPLALLSSVQGDDPINLINAIIDGVEPPDGVPNKSMPGFSSMPDDEISDLVAFIRHHFTDEPAWENVSDAIAESRRNFQ
ncbi:cytochrome c [Fodinicurvata sp. EGI_FJ10296]|uniref:cytochrome c n=1 Tax=Fodinicurvata sp. EGI_FJ10296 TaxID=3231908 RepID=UPI0034524ECD